LIIDNNLRGAKACFGGVVCISVFQAGTPSFTWKNLAFNCVVPPLRKKEKLIIESSLFRLPIGGARSQIKEEIQMHCFGFSC